MIKVSKQNFECLIDLGTNKSVCVICKKKENNNLKIIGWSHKKSIGIHKGKIIDTDVLSKNIINLIEEASNKISFKNLLITLNVSDPNIVLKEFISNINMGGLNISKKDIRNLYKKNLNVQISNQKKLIHSVPTKFKVDDKFYFNNPLGVVCNKLELESKNIFINLSLFNHFQSCIKDHRYTINELVDTSFSSSISALNEIEKNHGVSCIDIGAGLTKIITFHKNNIIDICYLLIGGNDVTNDISKGLEISTELAEYIKIVHGNLLFSQDKKINLNLINGKEKIIKQNLLHGIIKPRYEEIFELIYNRLHKIISNSIQIQKIVLTGGASQMSGIVEFTTKMLNRQSRLSSPLNELNYFSNKPEFSTIIGMIELQKHSAFKSINHFSKNNFFQNTFERFDNWIKEGLT